MPKDRSRLKTALQECSESIVPLLNAVKESSDVFPPLKSAVSIALIIGNMTAVCFDVASISVFLEIDMSRISNLTKRIGRNSAISFSKLLDVFSDLSRILASPRMSGKAIYRAFWSMQSPFIIFIIFIFDTDVITSDSTEHWKKLGTRLLPYRRSNCKHGFGIFSKTQRR